jgi:carbon-monoxide dehydrogenase large subunit
MGAYMRTNGAVGARNIAQFMSGPYRVPHIDIDVSLFLTNKTPVGTYRGPGRFETDFFRERLFDMAARDLGIDQVEFRRRNLVREAEMPYAVATIAPFESKDELDSGDYQVTLERCLAEIGWGKKAKLKGQCIDGRHHGLAVACFIEGGAAGPKESARLKLETDGTLTVYMGSSGVGQGLETAFAQIAADVMDVPMERINHVFHGSTAYVSDGYGSYHSRSIVMGGSALLDAAQKLRSAMCAEAARQLNCGPAEVTLAGERAIAPGGQSGSWAELASAEPLAAEGTFFNKKHTWAYGAHAAHVAVDARTGHVALLDYVAVENCGRIINPLTLKGQLIGATVQGLGGTFLEHLAYDENGQLLVGSLVDYLVPTASDFPNIRGYVMESHPSPINPLGAKGAGEGGIIPVGGVIANAVADALAAFGVEPRALPLSPSRVWQLLREAKARDAKPAVS